jgi:hypothetical protein
MLTSAAWPQPAGSAEATPASPKAGPRPDFPNAHNDQRPGRKTGVRWSRKLPIYSNPQATDGEWIVLSHGVLSLLVRTGFRGDRKPGACHRHVGRRGWSRSNQRSFAVDLTGIEPALLPQAASATGLSWNRGGWVGDVQPDGPWRPRRGAGGKRKGRAPCYSRGLRCVDLTWIEPTVRPQAAGATEQGWDWGGWVGNAPADTPRAPDTDQRGP